MSDSDQAAEGECAGRRNSKPRSGLKLPLRSMTLQQPDVEAFADRKSQQLLQSYSMDSEGPTEADGAHGACGSTSFKTKRFYETDEASYLMASFSQTIHSTSATPTDEMDIGDLLQGVALEDDGGAVTPTPMLAADEPLSLPEMSQSTHTDTIDMYNEPNMESLLDNLDGEVYLRHDDVDEGYIDDRSDRTDSESLSIWEALRDGTLDATVPCRTTTKTQPQQQAASSSKAKASKKAGFKKHRPPSIVVELYDDKLKITEEYRFLDDMYRFPDAEIDLPNAQNQPAESVPSASDAQREHVATPITPAAAPVAVAGAKQYALSYFDTTIDEEEEEELYEDNAVAEEATGGTPKLALDEEIIYNEFGEPIGVIAADPCFPCSPFSYDEEDDDDGGFANRSVYANRHLPERLSNRVAQHVSQFVSSASDPSSHVHAPPTPGMTRISSNASQSVKVAMPILTHADSGPKVFTSIKNNPFILNAKSGAEVPPARNGVCNGGGGSLDRNANMKVAKVVRHSAAVHEDDLSNIDVKSLCRSFGDLTDINSGKVTAGKVACLQRAKSFGDVRKLEGSFVFCGVSVQALKSSFSKFDVLQKKNILHVRSSDAGKAQEKFSVAALETEKNCKACNKVVYKMEEVKAEKNIWHKNCFRCHECAKQLNVDTYMSHESVLYCKAHFKLLFAPKVVEESEPERPKKPELIIRENQPVELPPDVVRASDKPDLGLEELQQLNVRSRFKVFEKSESEQTVEQNALERSPSSTGVKRSASILSKLAKFQAKGMNTGVPNDALNGVPIEISSSDEDGEADVDDDENEDPDLVRAKRAQRERPISFGNMNDIKTRFESGHIMSKEERREERKQEIQNIRSRLFMGKQARIKEMYQQAVADSEQGITSVGKKPEIDIGDKARSLKEKFEKGEIFNDEEALLQSSRVQEEEMAVFESGISKKSRSIFMELDASAAKSPQLLSGPTTPHTPDNKHRQSFPPVTAEQVVKCDEKADDVKIETSEISSKFKFFETYKPNELKKKEFRITPPRDGVVPAPVEDDDNTDANADLANHKSESEDDPIVAQKSHTTTKMLSMFREMEQKKHQSTEVGPKPLKRFTPPPDDNRRVYNDDSDEECSDDEDEDGEEEEEDDEECEEEDGVEENDSDGDVRNADRYEDEFLKQAKSAARAKQLRDKFEKWEANEIQREISNGAINLFADNVEQNQIESTKSLRAKFENMKETNKTPSRPRYQVNRFV